MEYINLTIQISYRLHAHYDMPVKCTYIGYIEYPHITTNDPAQQIKREHKINKLDPMEYNLLKILGYDTHCINI